jgi:hypothetical protein
MCMHVCICVHSIYRNMLILTFSHHTERVGREGESESVSERDG